MIYTAEVLELIDKERAKGLMWDEVAKIVTEQTGERVSGNAVRKGYAAHQPDETYDADHGLDVLIQKRRSQVSASSARSELKKSLDGAILVDDVLAGTKKLLEAVKGTTIPKVAKEPRNNAARKPIPMTVEALFSDLQLGKLSPDFNLEIAHKRIKEYTRSVIFKIRQHQKSGYNVEKTVLVLLGDIIESMDKAIQKGDAMSNEVDTPEQIRLAVEWIWRDVVVPLYQLNIPLHIIGIPGNHDHTGPGMKMFKAGKNQLSWIIYKQLELLCEACGMKEVTFDITEGVFTTYEFYGQLAYYEHGYGITPYVKNLQIRLNDRIRQTQKFGRYFRMGDKHSITRFCEDTLIVNGAFFGASLKDRGEEYSSVLGFSAQAAQLVLFHVPRNNPYMTTIYDSFTIQLSGVS